MTLYEVQPIQELCASNWFSLERISVFLLVCYIL